MALEIFQKAKHRKKRTEGSFVTIANDATRICFSYPLADWFSDNGVKSVNFLFDLEAKKIAFSPGSGDAYTLHRRQRSQGYVSARAFLEFIGNPTPGRYPASIDAENNMIIVDLSKDSVSRLFPKLKTRKN